MSATDAALLGTTLAAARSGPTIARLSPAPSSVGDAEAVQMATLAALGAARGGWKVGRLEGQIFSAPMPVDHLDQRQPRLVLPAGSRIELELALRFRHPLPARLDALDPLADAADLVVLLEFVRTRFSNPATVTAIERIADCVSNERVVAVTSPAPWSPAILEAPPPCRLLQDGKEIARHQGAHPAVPLLPLLEAWQRRCAEAGLASGPGEIITLGSLTGVLPVPPAGARYRGEFTGLPPVECTVAPLAGGDR